MSVTRADAETFIRCMAVGGVAVFPADTVYGLACDPEIEEAVRRLYAIKRRRPDKPAAVLFFDRDVALETLTELGDRTSALLERLLPGGVTVLLPNPRHRYRLACGPDPDTLGLRVPSLPDHLAPLGHVRRPVMQSSANLAGGPDARRLDDVPYSVRADADLVIDGGDLPGTPSTVVDLRAYDTTGEWSVLREGAVSRETIARLAA